MRLSMIESNMSDETVSLSWKGPFRWYDKEGDGLFDLPVLKLSGIYIWTVPYRGSYLANYVGETGLSFAKRFREHLQEYISGRYTVYDPYLYLQGKKELIWEGVGWKKDYEKHMERFLDRYFELFPEILRMIGTLEIFLIPFKGERRIRQRIESAIANHLYEQEGVIGSFQDKGVRYLPRREDETPVLVKIKSDIPILGFPEELIA